MTIDPPEMVVIGKITTVYGVKGWIKVHSYTEPMENLLAYESCFLQRNGSWHPLHFVEAKRHGKGLIALIDGVESREQARLYCQSNIAIAMADMPPLGEEDFYWYQLEGLQVLSIGPDDKPVLLGKVHHMMETGANDVLVVRGCKGSIDKRERLIPWLLEQVITKVNIEEGIILVDWDIEF